MKFEFADMIEEYGTETAYEKITTTDYRGKPSESREGGTGKMLIYPATPAELKLYAGGEYITEAYKVKTLRDLVLKQGDKIDYSGNVYSIFYVKNYDEFCDFYEYYMKRDVG